MLTEREVREMSARRTRAVAPAMAVATGATFLYLVGMGSFGEPLVSLTGDRLGDAARDIIPIALILPAFAIFLLPSCVAARYAERFRTTCPACHEDISRRTAWALATRRCPSCGVRVIDGGRAHSDAAFDRHRAFRTRRFLRAWLWAWPALGGLALAWQLLDRSAFQGCPQCVWIGPLVGAATAGWAWLRTSDRRYAPQLLASAILLGLGAVVFREALRTIANS